MDGGNHPLPEVAMKMLSEARVNRMQFEQSHLTEMNRLSVRHKKKYITGSYYLKIIHFCTHLGVQLMNLMPGAVQVFSLSMTHYSWTSVYRLNCVA